MNKKIKMFTFFAVMMNSIMCLSGCSSDQKVEKSSDKTSDVAINIEDIDWNVDEGIVNGDRYVLLDYTNNTEYTLSSFEITFKEKTDITEEEKTQFYNDIQQNFELSDDNMEDIKSKSISMHAQTDKLVDPDESVSNVYCYYYSGFYYLKDINHYELVEPDIATVKYIDGDKIYTVYYYYSSKKYSNEADTEIAYQWSQTELGNKVPKPDVKKVEVSGIDSESVFMFDAYGLSLEQFNAYVEKCKETGYTVDSSSFEGFYSADNTEGYNVYLYYDENNFSMSGTVSAPEKEN